MYGMELSREVRHYQETGEGWNELNRKIVLFIYQWGLGRKNLGEDRTADFLLSFLPRIKALVRNYSSYDCPFEHYVKVCLEWHMVKFHTALVRETRKEELYWQTAGRQDLLAAHDSPSPYVAERNEPEKTFPPAMRDKRFRKRFLEYILYHVDCFSYGMIDSYADYLGMGKDDLFRKIKQAEELIVKKRDRREAIMEKKRSYYIDHKYHEMKLKITEEQKTREEIRERMDRLTYKIERLNARIRRIKMTPTAEQVGLLTGSSSSTVGRNIKMVRDLLVELADENPGG